MSNQRMFVTVGIFFHHSIRKCLHETLRSETLLSLASEILAIRDKDSEVSTLDCRTAKSTNMMMRNDEICCNFCFITIL